MSADMLNPLEKTEEVSTPAPETRHAVTFTKATYRITGTRNTNMGPMQAQIGEKQMEQMSVWPLSTTLAELAEYLDVRKTNNLSLVIENGQAPPKDERVDQGIVG